MFSKALVRTDYEFSVVGLRGLMARFQEGMKLDMLRLNFGIDPPAPAIKLSTVGRIGGV